MGELARCTRHGLAYDPAVQNGCTVCRREQSQRPAAPDEPSGGGGGAARTLFFIVSLISASSGVYYLYKKLNKPPPAPIGGSCTAESGCETGADCMSGGFGLEKYGQCYRRCVSDDACPGQKCSSGHCMAPPTCGGGTICSDTQECVTLVGRGAFCLQQCRLGSFDGCPQGTTCTRVMNSAMPGNMALATDYCVPDR